MLTVIIYQDAFLVSGIMCYQGCGIAVKACLEDIFEEIKKTYSLPIESKLIMDTEPATVGIHRLFIAIETPPLSNSIKLNRKLITEKFQSALTEMSYDVVTEEKEKKSSKVNQINVFLNVIAMLTIGILWLTFPPSLLLTFVMMGITAITTTITSRHYLKGFFQNFRQKSFANMSTSIGLGWMLALIHMLYHLVTMGMFMGFPMIFMNLFMPLILITLVNGMDEIKRLVLKKSKSMYLQNMTSLFPEMANEYECVEQPLSENTNEVLLDAWSEQSVKKIKKSFLKDNMLIKVKQGQCFPVDGVIVQGHTFVDTSLLTGETQQEKSVSDFVPSGAVNLGNDIIIRAREDAYTSTINQILFRSNRSREKKIKQAPQQRFFYLYSTIIGIAITASVLVPIVFGVFTFSLLLASVTGILFAICPCTITLGLKLPSLLSLYQRGKKNINLRSEDLIDTETDIHTIIFDKTGTLTTGNSLVESSEGINSHVWHRIYLLEKNYGAGHPLAHAITEFYEEKKNPKQEESLIQDIRNLEKDSKNRGLSALVQGKKIHIGSLNYLQDSGIKFPENLSQSPKLTLGYTPVYIAEDGYYQGVIFIKHELRKNIIEDITHLQKAGTRIIMLTGDSKLSAQGLNEQMGSLFSPEDIHAEQTPQDKENFLTTFMGQLKEPPEGVWFVCDGLNDTPAATELPERGGVSCAMAGQNKAAFFTNISLDGSLTYLFKHAKINRFLKKNILQNQVILIGSALIYLGCMLIFSVTGLMIVPVIPLIIMLSTTILILFNSYRAQLSVDCLLDSKKSWFKRFLVSDLSIALLIGISALLLICLTISVVSALILPLVISTLIVAINSVVIIGGLGLLGLVAVVGMVFFMSTNKDEHRNENVSSTASKKFDINIKMNPLEQDKYQKEPFFSPLSNKQDKNSLQSFESSIGSETQFSV